MNFSAGINTGNEGLYWLGEIMKKDPNSIVVMITAYGDQENFQAAERLGADDFLTKPVEFSALKEKLKELTRTNKTLSKSTIHQFIESLDVSDEVKRELKNISPENYVGIYQALVCIII